VNNTGVGIRMKQTALICSMSSNSEDRKGFASWHQSNTFPAVLVAENFCPGAGSVRYVQPNGNGRERSEHITNEKSPRHGLLKMRISCDADSVERSVNRGIPSAQSVQKDKANSQIVKDSDGITEKE